jgi:hypothetical protein
MIMFCFYIISGTQHQLRKVDHNTELMVERGELYYFAPRIKPQQRIAN